MTRPTIALCCILKNEVENLPRLLASVKDCFDEIHLTDTGSTDGSIELIESWIKAGENPAGSRLKLHHFTWVDDFAAARNASFAPATTDYIMWMDLDDKLSSAPAFIAWRNDALKLADFWFATYHYALGADGESICSFARERVVKRGIGIEWRYFVHEGMVPKTAPPAGFQAQYCSTWNVMHLRTEADVQKDRSRNLLLFERHKRVLDARMRYYYGKELFENGRHLEAHVELSQALGEANLEAHDRVMATQYSTLAAMALGQFDQAIKLAFQGLHQQPQRAEYFIAIGDSFARMNRPLDAVPYYEAATRCSYQGTEGVQAPIFQHRDAYRHYPLNMLAKIMAAQGQMDAAERYSLRALEFGPNAETETFLKDVRSIKERTQPVANREAAEDILITCPPAGLYEWDDEVYEKKGIGGSETAAVEMARHLSALTGRRVIIFNSRKERASFGLVEYRPSHELADYLKHYKPALHVGWRHCYPLSEDPMYVWCHDLAAMGFDSRESIKKAAGILALSPFHAKFLQNMHNVPEEKILLTRNGIDPKRFQGPRPQKDPFKIVYSSSPDRGLEKALLVMDEVVKREPRARLHVFYGFDNMQKMGLGAEAERLLALMAQRTYVSFHGNLPQKRLTEELKTAAVWLYPTTFLETYCITALEMLCSGVYPVVRSWGALPDTLAKAHANGFASVLDTESVERFSDEVIDVLSSRKWEKMSVDPAPYSWESVARDWICLFKLNEGAICPPLPERRLSSTSP